jgi:dipeptidase E
MIPVLGLREGSWLDVKGDTIALGKFKLDFKQNKTAVEINTNTDLMIYIKKSRNN